MKIVFVSNFFNHHQKPFSEEMYKLTDEQYVFIQTQPMSEERKSLGWGDIDVPKYVKFSYVNQEEYSECISLINEADVVIAGSAPESMLKARIKSKKLTFRYSERIYKNKKKYLTLPLRFLKYLYNNHFSKNIYMLCASAYAKRDYNLTLNYIGKCYKWGYFPELVRYEDIDKIIKEKEDNSILWCARMIYWKHPEIPLKVTKKLKEEGYNIKLNMIGNGILEGDIKKLIEKDGLSDCVNVLGAMSPNNVRKYMEKSQIFLFTSDQNEGWGAVLNEAMNSGCGVVANKKIGSAPYLITNGQNGFTYKNFNELYSNLKFLLDNKDKREEMSKNAYHTISNVWNAKEGAIRLLQLFENVLNGNKHNAFRDGPCSKA